MSLERIIYSLCELAAYSEIAGFFSCSFFLSVFFETFFFATGCWSHLHSQALQAVAVVFFLAGLSPLKRAFPVSIYPLVVVGTDVVYREPPSATEAKPTTFSL